MEPEPCAVDVCVVGGGPAGLTLALLLTRSGVRVAVVEKDRAQGREFRGEILQPGAMALLDRLGVLAGARARGAHELSAFRLVEGERVLLDIDYRALSGPYATLLSIPQPHLLGELLEHCAREPGFEYLEGSRVTRLLRDGERVTGVVATGPGGPREVTARCVVAADGRFSKVRRLADIPAGREEAFDLDVLWFKLTVPGRGGGPRAVRVFRAGGNPVLVYDSWPDRVQLGWTLPHRGYGAIAARGIDFVKQQLATAVPEYAAEIHEQIRSARDVSLLDVFSGRAARWAGDGLVLIGDAAHTHSPIGAQGINLAVQDAALLHPLLCEALDRGDTSAAALAEFERRRAPDIRTVMRVQRIQSRAMLSGGAFATRVRPRLARLLRHTPAYRRILDHIAFGNRDIRIAEERFAPRVRLED